MHILIIADAIDTQNAGIHFYTKNLIENLLKIDHKNRYSFIHSRKHPFFEGKNHHIIPKKKGLGAESIRRSIRIPLLIRSINPDLVLEPCHIGPFNIPKHIKRVVTIHDITPVLFPGLHTARGRIVHKLLLKRTLRNADLILTPSETTKNDILSRYKTKNNITVIPLGIPITRPQETRPIEEPYFLYLGTIEPRKNLRILIESFNELNLFGYKLILAGPVGWKSENLLNEIAQNSNIVIKGYLNEEQKAQYLTHAKAFIYPSLYEGFGIPPMEALSYGIPTITSTGGSLKEYFGKHAFTFDPQDKQTLNAHLKTILDNPHLSQEFSIKGPLYAKSFTWQKTAEKTLAALEDLFFTQPPPPPHFP